MAEDVWEEDAPPAVNNEESRSEGECSIADITDNQGNRVNPTDLEIRLQTLKLDEGYWLDTGIVIDAG